MRRPSEQMVKTIGVKIHANLPTLPMMPFCELLQMIERWRMGGDGCRWMSDEKRG